MNFEKILVPLDGSPLAEAALARAAALAKRDDAALRLLRAVEASPLLGIDPAQIQVEIVREAEEYLASVAARLGKDGVKKVETSVWYGPAASSIVEAVHLHKADLIVMSTHGRVASGGSSWAAWRSPCCAERRSRSCSCGPREQPSRRPQAPAGRARCPSLPVRSDAGTPEERP